MTPLQTLRQHLLKRFELYVLAYAAAFVAVAAVLVQSDVSAAVAFAAAVVGMGGIQAAVQWADRERQRHLRAQAIHEIREMLRDQVLNQLSAMKMWVAESPDPATVAVLLADVDESIDEIAAMIDRLTEAQLDTWKLTYANAADHVGFGSPVGA